MSFGYEKSSNHVLFFGQVNLIKLSIFPWFKALFSNALTCPCLENMKLTFQGFQGGWEPCVSNICICVCSKQKLHENWPCFSSSVIDSLSCWVLFYDLSVRSRRQDWSAAQHETFLLSADPDNIKVKTYHYMYEKFFNLSHWSAARHETFPEGESW